MVFFSHLKKLDWVMVGSILVLVAFGLAAIWSTSLAKDNFSNFEKQLVFFVIGFSLMILLSFFDWRLLQNNSYLILFLYVTSLALLAGLHFFAPTIRGTRGWYRLGFLSLDPIEPAKIFLIALLAKYFSARHAQMYRFRHIVISGIYVLLPVFLIFLKPDLGGAAVLVFVWLGILLVSGIKLKHFLILSVCFMLVAGFSWQFLLKDYQKARVVSFVFPYDTLGGSWNQQQANISIGSGQLFGKGLGQGSQVQYGFLPEPHTDFIFSVIAEEWGLAGISVLFLAYLVLVWRMLKIAIETQTNFPRLFVIGFSVMLVAQFVVNIGMNLSLLPVVGLYLPFVSYGGSGLIANFIGIGILQSIRARR